jgi:hypothetical protein
MFSEDAPQPADQPLVQTILEPLLDDFLYWFDETESLLASIEAECLVDSESHALIEEIKAARQEVVTTKTLMLATGGDAGVEVAVVGRWHQLVSKCWRTARQVRQRHQTPDTP